MGRGRAKAKQQKVARRLKYSSGGTDLDRLRAELGVAEDEEASGDASDDSYVDSHDDLIERYADFAEKDAIGDAAEEERSDHAR